MPWLPQLEKASTFFLRSFLILKYEKDLFQKKFEPTLFLGESYLHVTAKFGFSFDAGVSCY